ncbi:uncharacterized protein LOC125904009 [Scomber scombrus]|uniref:Uncharacterized protein LOC125904009 n=1 Tax=Scomber scombrus TaxID=13677 RepID=A0AAV1PK82_SCOSC
MGKCKFIESWLDDVRFRNWLTSVANPQGQKRKAAEDHIADLKKKKQTLLEVCGSLEKDADMFAEQAEGKSGTLMAQLITKSNVLRKRYKEKFSELKKIEAELEIKATELRLI